MPYHKWSLVIMRAQPFHKWHKVLVDRALMTTPNVLLILGSFNEERTARNPFFVHERRRMIEACYPHTKRLVVAGAFDMPGDDVAWREQIESIVEQVTGQERALLVANCKDGEDYLPRIFNDWPMALTHHNYGFSATEIRNDYFEGLSVNKLVPVAVNEWLLDFARGEDWHHALDAYMRDTYGAA